MNEKKIKIDPHLLTYIYKSLHRYPDNLYDMTKIKQLDCDGYIASYDFYYENVPVIIEICEGAWEIIGEMKKGCLYEILNCLIFPFSKNVSGWKNWY